MNQMTATRTEYSNLAKNRHANVLISSTGNNTLNKKKTKTKLNRQFICTLFKHKKYQQKREKRPIFHYQGDDHTA